MLALATIVPRAHEGAHPLSKPSIIMQAEGHVTPSTIQNLWGTFTVSTFQSHL